MRFHVLCRNSRWPPKMAGKTADPLSLSSPLNTISLAGCRPSFLSLRQLLLIYTDGHNGKGQSSHVLVFCVNFERHIYTHIATNIKCYLHSLRYVSVPFTNISCQSNCHVYISTYFQNVNKPSTLHSSLQKNSWLLKAV